MSKSIEIAGEIQAAQARLQRALDLIADGYGGDSAKGIEVELLAGLIYGAAENAKSALSACRDLLASSVTAQKAEVPGQGSLPVDPVVDVREKPSNGKSITPRLDAAKPRRRTTVDATS